MRLGKPHPEQTQIGMPCGGPPRIRVARSRRQATAVLDKWPSNDRTRLTGPLHSLKTNLQTIPLTHPIGRPTGYPPNGAKPLHSDELPFILGKADVASHFAARISKNHSAQGAKITRQIRTLRPYRCTVQKILKFRYRYRVIVRPSALIRRT